MPDTYKILLDLKGRIPRTTYTQMLRSILGHFESLPEEQRLAIVSGRPTVATPSSTP